MELGGLVSSRQIQTAAAPTLGGNVDTAGMTATRVPVASSATTLVDSSRSDDGTIVTERLPIDHGFNQVINPLLAGFLEDCPQLAPAGAAETLDWLAANSYELALAGNTSITLDNIPAAIGVRGTIAIGVIDTPGGSALSFTDTINWGTAGAPPALAAGEGIMITISTAFGALWGQWVGIFS